MNLRQSLFILLTCGMVLDSATLTVCASGCGHTTLQSAITAAVAGDIIELTAGETFTGTTFIQNKRDLKIRGSRWQEFSPGVRAVASAEDIAKMPTLTPSSFTTGTIYLGEQPINVALNGVNTTTDTITFEGYSGLAANDLADGAEVTCYAVYSDHHGVLPAPLVINTKYYIRDWSSGPRTAKLAMIPGGAAIDITTIGSSDVQNSDYGGSGYYSRPFCTRSNTSPNNILIQGIRFYDGSNQGPVITVGGNTTDYSLGPQNITFDHILIEGDSTRYDRPAHGIGFGVGHNYTLRDSTIRNIVSFGNENKAVFIYGADNVLIQNNYLSSGSINLLTGGSDVPNQLLARNISVIGNTLAKPGHLMYLEGVGAPTGACYYGGPLGDGNPNSASGMYYRRTDVTQTCADGACYTCQSNSTWGSANTSGVYRASFNQNKNLLEFKDCSNCAVKGNFFTGQQQNGYDAGQGWAFGLSVISVDTVSNPVGGYNRGWNISIEHNWAHRTWTGLYLRNSTYGGPFSAVPIRNVFVNNNLLTNLSEFPALCGYTPCSASNGTQPNAFLISAGQSGLTVRHNTIRGWPSYGHRFNTTAAAYTPNAFTAFRGLDNLIEIKETGGAHSDMAAVVVDGGIGACTNTLWHDTYGDTFFTNDTYWVPSGVLWGLDLNNNCSLHASNALKATTDPLFTGTPSLLTPNSALQATSVYSDQNASATHLASDNSSMGVDEKQLTQWTIPAVNGTRNMREQLSLRATRSGTTLNINFAARGQSCTVTVYSAVARTTANQAASPQTNSTGTFTFTGISTNPAWYHVDCTSTLGLHWVDTI